MAGPVFKRNNGGEIRGYEMAQGPRTPPYEETTSVIIPLKGAGDAVRSQYSDEVGARRPLEMYQQSGEVGNDTRIPEDTSGILSPEELEMRATQYSDPAASDTFSHLNTNPQAAFMQESSLRKEGLDKQKAVEMKTRVKALHEGEFKEDIYNQLVNLSPRERRDYIPDGTEGLTGYEVAAYTTPEAMYNTLAIEKHNFLANRRLNYDMDKNAYDAVTQRFFAKKQLNELEQSLEQEVQTEMFNLLNGRQPEDLNPEEQAKFDELSNVAVSDLWGDEERDWYTKIADYDKKLNFRQETDDLDGIGYDSSKFSTSRNVSNTIQGGTSALNDFLTENLGTLGSMVGEGVQSAGNLADPEKHYASFRTALGEQDLAAFEKAAVDAGLDAVNAFALLTVATGGGTLKSLATLVRKVGSTGALKLAMQGGKKVLSSYRKLPRIARIGMEYGVLGQGIYGAGKAGYNYMNREEGEDIYDVAIEELGSDLARTTFGANWKDTGNLKRLMEVEVDPSAIYTDMDSYLDQHPEWDNISDAHSYFYPEEGVPTYLSRRFDTDYDVAEDAVIDKGEELGKNDKT